jgi:hypothetical protein
MKEMSMTSRNDKTKNSQTLIAFTISVVAVLIISVSGVMAADKLAKDEELAVATVEFVNPDSGVILLMVDKTRKVTDIDSGDQIEIVVEEGTNATNDQRPRKWRMMRHPYGGPSDK